MSALFCSIGGYKVEQLSSPVYGPDLVGEENSTSQTYFSSMVPLDMPQGQYLSYGVVWYNGAGYQTGNAYFKLGKVPTITITSPQNGFQVDDKVLVVTGTCEDLDLTEATLLTNGQSYPVKLVNGEFSTKVVLRPGRNDIRITAENDSGESSDSVSGVARINASVLKVVLIWEAAKTDVDLWVTDPEGKVTYYSNKSPGEGRKLDIDDQRGPGAETYTMEKVIPGNYQVDVLYYSAHGYQGSVPFRLEVTSWETTPYESRSSANGVLYKPGGREKKAGSFQTFNFQLKPQMNAFY